MTRKKNIKDQIFLWESGSFLNKGKKKIIHWYICFTGIGYMNLL